MRTLSATILAAAVTMCSTAVAAERWNMFSRRLGMFVRWGIYSVGEWHEQEHWRKGMRRADYEKFTYKEGDPFNSCVEFRSLGAP